MKAQHSRAERGRERVGAIECVCACKIIWKCYDGCETHCVSAVRSISAKFPHLNLFILFSIIIISSFLVVERYFEVSISFGGERDEDEL